MHIQQVRVRGRVAIVGLALLAFGVSTCSASSGMWDSAPQGASLTVPIGSRSPSLAQTKAQFQRAAERNPGDKFAWYNLGVIAQGEHDKRGAEADFLKSVAIDPNFESALYNEGLLRFHADDISGAVTYLRRAVTANPKDANAHWLLGIALSRIGGAQSVKAEAKRELHAALALDPGLLGNAEKNGLPGCNGCPL